MKQEEKKNERILLTDEQLEEVEISARTRRNLVYVPQGNSLFSGTIRENLLLGDPEADEARLKPLTFLYGSSCRNLLYHNLPACPITHTDDVDTPLGCG